MNPITQNRVLQKDDNGYPVMGGTSSVDNNTIVNSALDPVTRRLLTDAASGSGTVSSVSVVTANGFSGSVADPTTTPAITITTTETGILQGNGTAISPITVGSGLSFVAGTLSASVPSTITVADESTDASCFVAFFTAATGNLQPKTNANLTFNSSTGAMTVGSTLTAGTFVPTSSSAPTNGMYLLAANTLGWSVNSAAELQLTSTALSPAVDGGSSLGTTALGWQNLFGNTGFVWNIENGDWVATHTSGILTVGTGDLRVTNAGSNSASVVTVGGTQTLTGKTLTSPTITTATLSGAQQLAEGAGLRLDASLSADGTYSGTTIAGTAGTTLAFGDLIYLAVADSRWELTDADSSTTAGGVLTGICVLAAAADGDPTVILLQGNIRADAAFPSLTVGAPVYASTTPGDVQVTQPNGADDVIHVVGFALTADSMYFNPSPDYITHT